MTNQNGLPLALRRRLVRNVEALPKRGRVGIALSGGVDSCSVLAAARQAGIRLTVFTYTPDTHESTDYVYARQTARLLGLDFVEVAVPMDTDSLLTSARQVIGLGYRTKMQVESLTPMLHVARAAVYKGMRYLLTGDQADGYYINGNWISRNYDRSQGIPGRERQHVKLDATAERIDKLRDLYWNEDRANCAALSEVGQYAGGVHMAMPYRHLSVRTLFLGEHWREINEPRLKETTWQAFPELEGEPYMVRSAPVNLHRGDSLFADVMGSKLRQRFPQYKTALGVYGGIARGEV